MSAIALAAALAIAVEEVGSEIGVVEDWVTRASEVALTASGAATSLAVVVAAAMPLAEDPEDIVDRVRGATAVAAPPVSDRAEEAVASAEAAVEAVAVDGEGEPQSIPE